MWTCGGGNNRTQMVLKEAYSCSLKTLCVHTYIHTCVCIHTHTHKSENEFRFKHSVKWVFSKMGVWVLNEYLKGSASYIETNGLVYFNFVLIVG